MILIIDSITNGSGGYKRHLSEILKYSENDFCKFKKIIVWGPNQLLNLLPSNQKIIKRTHLLLNIGVLGFFLFNLFFKKRYFNKDYDCIYSPSGSFTLNLHPYVSMSRNMLMFDEVEQKRFGISIQRVKLKYIYYVNKKSFENSDGLIFLSNYAKNKINNLLNLDLTNQRIINHGISNNFQKEPSIQKDLYEFNYFNPYKLLYISHIFPYKHHLNVIKAIQQVQLDGYNIHFTIIGNSFSKSLSSKIESEIKDSDKIVWIQDVPINVIRDYFHKCNAFIFASTCENMPNTLIEAMSSGLPILSSNFDPMKEFLEDGGVYFNPLSSNSIYNSIKELIDNKKLREKLSNKSYSLSKKYSWKKCAEETFNFLHEIALIHKQKSNQ